MNNFPRTISTAGVLVLLSVSPAAIPQSPSDVGQAPKETADRPAKGLANLLKIRGYVEAPLALNKTGWLDVKVEVEGLPMLLMLDTGANNINLDRNSAKRAKLTVKEVEGKTSASGGFLTAGSTKIGRLSVAGLTSPADSYVVDFSRTNATRKARGDLPCDGVLGGSFLKYWSAVIDYAHLKLYLLSPAQRAQDLTPLLKKRGYVELPLALNKTGLLDVKVEVDAVPMLLFLDTGHSSIISLDRPSAKRARLAVKETEGKSSQLGGILPTGQARIGRLNVGGVTAGADAQVADYSPTNVTRKGRGDPPSDGTLGGGYLKDHSAVIDYAHQKLYLLDRVAK